MSHLLDFAVITIFAREFLEGTIVLGEYRTIIQRGGPAVLEPGVTRSMAHQAVWTAAWVAIAAALLVIAAVAIPLSVLSRTFDDKTSKIIEGLNKMVAGVCLLQLSLKLPKFLGVYGSTKTKKKAMTTMETNVTDGEPLVHKDTASSVATDTETRTAPFDTNGAAIQLGAATPVTSSEELAAPIASSEELLAVTTSSEELMEAQTNSPSATSGEPNDKASSSPSVEFTAQAQLSLKSIRFNVAWNIWREVAECGVFLIPFFLSGEDLESIPVSAVVGSIVGSLMGWAIYIANRRFTDKRMLAAFVAALLLVLSAGLFTGGAHNLEVELKSTRTVWQLHGDFWSIDRLPMTVLKPFGYNDSRTVLEICTYWSWLALGAALHWRKYQRAPKIDPATGQLMMVESSSRSATTAAAAAAQSAAVASSSTAAPVVPPPNNKDDNDDAPQPPTVGDEEQGSY